jgi:lysophospholipid hydrolase
MQVNAGQVLWRPEDVSDSFYIVINGRLRAITEKEVGGVKITGEYGQGDTVGELDVITSSPRRTTVHAIRDTELNSDASNFIQRYLCSVSAFSFR